MTMKKCAARDCDKQAIARGYCQTHYARWYRNGDLSLRVKKRPQKCTADNCNQKHFARGYCTKHYERFKKHGGIETLQVRRVGCLVDGCEGKHRGAGYCDKHYSRFRRYGDPLGGGVFRSSRDGKHCRIKNCGRKVVSAHEMLCSKHYSKWKKHGDPCAGYEWGQKNSDQWHRQGGYIVRYEPNNPSAGSSGYVYQHRHVMAEIIGRPLDGNESVHHINGQRDDNRPENLELWIKRQPPGQRASDLVAWAEEILERYGDLVSRGVI